jgi:hypothetical protein
LVYPYLIYGNLVWGNAYKSHIKKLVNIQRKIVRLITFKSYSDHTEPIFSDLNILNLYKLNDFLTSLFMFRYFNLQNLPEIFDKYFLTNKEIHNIIIQETHYCYTKIVLEQIIKNTRLLITASMFGIIFQRNVSKLDLP